MVSLSLALFPLSWALAVSGVDAVHPTSGERLIVKSLFAPEFLQSFAKDFAKNIGGFPAIPVVLLLLLAAGVAEKSGFFDNLVRSIILQAPRLLLTPTLIIAGLLAHLASDAAYVVIVPLGAMIFAKAGRHPVAGLMAMFAAVGAGGQLLVTPLDGVLLGLTDAAARTILPNYTTTIVGIYWLNLAHGALSIVIFWIVTDVFVEPRLGPWRAPERATSPGADDSLKALWIGSLAGVGVIAAFVLAALIPGGPLATPSGNLDGLLGAMTFVVFCVLLASGAAHGSVNGSMKSGTKIIQAMEKSLAEQSGLIIVLLAAALLNILMSSSNIGLVTAVQLANVVSSIGATPTATLSLALILPLIIDFVMPGATGKWVLLSPILVPTLMTQGWSPEIVTAAYRIGDTPINILNPLMIFVPMTFAMAQIYMPELTIGKFLKFMAAYAVPMALVAFAMTLIWAHLGLPPGPGASATISLENLRTN